MDSEKVLEFGRKATLKTNRKRTRFSGPQTKCYTEYSSLSAILADARPYRMRQTRRQNKKKKFAIDLTDKELDALIETADTNGDGQLDYEEFAALMMA